MRYIIALSLLVTGCSLGPTDKYCVEYNIRNNDGSWTIHTFKVDSPRDGQLLIETFTPHYLDHCYENGMCLLRQAYCHELDD